MELLVSIAKERKGEKPISNKTFAKWGTKLEELFEIEDDSDITATSDGKETKGKDYNLNKVGEKMLEEEGKNKHKNVIPRWTSKITIM